MEASSAVWEAIVRTVVAQGVSQAHRLPPRNRGSRTALHKGLLRELFHMDHPLPGHFQRGEEATNIPDREH